MASIMCVLVCRDGQKVNIALVKKWVSYMPGKDVKLKIAIFKILFVLVQVMSH